MSSGFGPCALLLLLLLPVSIASGESRHSSLKSSLKSSQKSCQSNLLHIDLDPGSHQSRLTHIDSIVETVALLLRVPPFPTPSLFTFLNLSIHEQNSPPVACTPNGLFQLKLLKSSFVESIVDRYISGHAGPTTTTVAVHLTLQ